MTQEKLKNCPFCGGEGKLYTEGVETGDVALVYCNECKVKTSGWKSLGHDTKYFPQGQHVHEACLQWNARADKTNPVDVESQYILDWLTYNQEAFENYYMNGVSGNEFMRLIAKNLRTPREPIQGLDEALEAIEDGIVDNPRLLWVHIDKVLKAAKRYNEDTKP